jgi:hypothetical protein
MHKVACVEVLDDILFDPGKTFSLLCMTRKVLVDPCSIFRGMCFAPRKKFRPVFHDIL